MNPSEYILNLVNTTLEGGSRKVSDLVRQSARIARLRNDYVNLWWLEWEMIDITEKEERLRPLNEILPHFTKEQYSYFQKKFYEMWANERNIVHIDDDNNIRSNEMILPKGVGEVENNLEHFIKMAAEAVSPQGLHSLDLYYKEQSNTKIRSFARIHEKNCKNILSRVRNRVSVYLSNVEKQIIFGQIHSDIFEENRFYVDRKLGEICPDALAKFVAAYQRTKENNPESWAQALTSCRRLLKSLADTLYPPTDKLVKGADGKERKLTDELYVARLWQYVYERTLNSTSGALLQSQVQDYGNRIDRLYEMSCKGVHAEVTKFEVNQCLIQTYIIAGDLLRLSEGDSALDENLSPDTA